MFEINHIENIFIIEYAFENVICKVSAMFW